MKKTRKIRFYIRVFDIHFYKKKKNVWCGFYPLWREDILSLPCWDIYATYNANAC